MSTTLQIILGEAFLLVFVLAIVLSFFNWKKKKQQHAELDALLDQISGAETDRKSHIKDYLVSRYKIDVSDAVLLSEDFIAAEKKFLYEYLEQQFQHKTNATFYENTCQLLDKYLELLPNTVFQEMDNEQNNEQSKDRELEKSDAVPDSEIDVQQPVDEFVEIPAEESEAQADETTQSDSSAISGSDNAEQNESEADSSVTDDLENIEQEEVKQQGGEQQEPDSDTAGPDAIVE